MTKISTISLKVLVEDDVTALDVVFITAYTLNDSSKMSIQNCRSIYESFLRQIVKYNLKLRHDLSENTIKEKLKVLDQLYLHGFLGYSNRDKILNILSKFGVAKEKLQKFAREKLQNLGKLDKKVLSFFLNLYGKYFAISKSELLKVADHELRRLTLIFDKMFDETLLAQNVLKREYEEHIFLGNRRYTGKIWIWILGTVSVQLLLR